MGDLDLVPEAVLVLDAERRLVAANDRAGALLGVDAAAVGTPLAGLVSLERDGAPCPDPVPARGVADRLTAQDLVVRLPDGRARGVVMAGRWQPDGGVVLTFRGTGARDAHVARQADVVATVAHELRSPLASVRGFVRTLLARWERFSDEQRHTLLETVAVDAERVGELLEELLEVARIDAGRVPVQREPVDLVALVRDVVRRAAARSDDVESRVEVVDRGAPARVPADRARVEQVLVNLLDNALLHAPDAAVRIVLDARDGRASVAVEDDGPGIGADEHATVFARFGRGRGAHRPGTGLGLHLARGLARAHGGDVTLASARGHGATFTLWLPLVPPVG